MRCKRKKRGIDLSFPKTIGPSRFITNSENCHNKFDLTNNHNIVEIDLEKDVEIIDISEDQNEIRDAAISLINRRQPSVLKILDFSSFTDLKTSAVGSGLI